MKNSYMEKAESIENSVKKYFQHFERALDLYKNIPSIGEYNSIGMGGSGIAGRFMEDMGFGKSISCYYNKGLEIKLEKNKNVIVSYSGNTRETLSWIREGRIREYVALTSGGELEKHALESGNYLIRLPKNLQPRASFPYMLVALAKLHSKKTYEKIKIMFNEALENKEHIEEEAKEIANKLKEPIMIYGDCFSKTIAYRGKTQLNENGKALALFNYIPEMLHNEVEGLKDFEGSILILWNENNTKKIINAIGEVFSDKNILSYYVSKNIIAGVYFVDVLSVEYAKRNGIVDLSNVNVIKKLKVKINE